MKQHYVFAIWMMLFSLGMLSGTAKAIGTTTLDDGVVFDPTTNVVWLKDASCLGKSTSFNDALAKIRTLAPGVCGLKDGSNAGEWRLPTINELSSRYTNRYGFKNIRQDGYYWSMTWDDKCEALVLDMKSGRVLNCVDGTYVWPVRAAKKGFGGVMK